MHRLTLALSLGHSEVFRARVLTRFLVLLSVPCAVPAKDAVGLLRTLVVRPRTPPPPAPRPGACGSGIRLKQHNLFFPPAAPLIPPLPPTIPQEHAIGVAESPDRGDAWQPRADHLVYYALAAVPFAGQDFVDLAPEDVAELFGRVGHYLALRERGVRPGLQLVSPATDDFLEDIWVRIRGRGARPPSPFPPSVAFEDGGAGPETLSLMPSSPRPATHRRAVWRRRTSRATSTPRPSRWVSSPDAAATREPRPTQSCFTSAWRFR